jgi:hypothetical protein
MEFFHVGSCTNPEDNAKFGIYLYRDAIPRKLNIPERLEAALAKSTNNLFKWSEALVGYNEKMPEYRDCVDLKMHPNHWQYLTPEVEDIKNCYEDVESNLRICIEHYESMYNMKMEYMEAINFVRYGEGQHFDVHSDHGFSYTCTVSSVMYLNDDYECGELYFKNFDYTYTPSAGDIVICPANYMYAHASLPVKSGIKYAAVTMYDWNDKFHKE